MQIETYEIEEMRSSEASSMAADSEASELVNQLGLDGQSELYNPESGTRFQYPRLTSHQESVLRALFPVSTHIKSYRDGIIPLRVLQVAAYCKDFAQTKYLTVWHAASPKEDPVLVGAPNEYAAERYLLARWGESLLPFEELAKKALPIIKTRLAAEIASAIQKLRGYEGSIDVIAEHYLNSGQKPTWTIYD